MNDEGDIERNVWVAPTIAGIAPVGCGDDPCDGREGPRPEAWSDFRADLTCIRDWLTRDWLCASGSHPVRDVWRRHDAGASLELMCLGTSLRRVLPKARAAPGGTTLLADWKRRITGTNLANMRGSLFEVYLAGLFDSDDHPIQTVTAGQEGYDFAVTFTGGGTLRVSCKSRDDSNEERTAAAFTAALRDLIRARIPPGLAVAIHVFAPPNAPAWMFNADAILPRVRLAVGAARFNRPLPAAPATDWQVTANLLNCPQAGLVFREGDRLSFSLLVGVPLDAEKIAERFRQVVQDALRNVEDHCDVGAGCANVIVYRIPSRLSLADARKAVLDAMESTTCTRTSSVFLYRALLQSGGPQRPFYLGHELAEVENKGATSAATVIPKGTVALKIHVGRVQTVEPVTMITDGERSYPIGPDMFTRMHGEHYYRRPDWTGGTFQVRRVHGVAQWVAHAHLIVGGIKEFPLSAEIQDSVTLL